MRASRTKELRALTLLDMGGLLLRDLWVTVWPVIRKPPDAGFSIPFFPLDLAHNAVLPASHFVALVKYCDFGSY